MNIIEQRLSEIEKTPFPQEEAAARLDIHFTENPALGVAQAKEYQGYFLDPFGVDFHAFEVTVTGNGAGIDCWGVAVTQELIAVTPNLELHRSTMEAGWATKLG